MTEAAQRPSLGPRDPLPATPARWPSSVRRTTSIDQARGAPGAPQSIHARGRDLRTEPDGSGTVLDEVDLHLEVDGSGTVTQLATEPAVPALDQLVGGHISKGLRGRVDELVPEHRDRASVLHQLLDDLPMAHLISGYGFSREQPAFTLPPGSADRLTDLCSGWRADSTMLGIMEETGLFPIPIGPPAPDLAVAGDPFAWHDLPTMPPRSIRRRRRLDVWIDGVIQVDAHFRDSHSDEDLVEDVLHEYQLAARVDPRSSVVLASGATVRVLPWPECPGAVGSAERIVGHAVHTLRPMVSAELTGTTTCTHLNDVMRSLAAVAVLARQIGADAP